MGDGEREPIQSVRAIDRIAFFSDAVFAIAMTLLVLQLRLPSATTEATLAHDLAELGNQYVSFVLSFLVISMFWRTHHRRFDVLRAYDDRLIVLNTVLLMSIVFLPFPTEVLGHFVGRTATIFYAASMLVVGAVSLLNTWYVFYADLVSERVTPAERATVMWSSIAFIVLFGLSIPAAFLSVAAAQVMWAAVLLTRRVVPLVARRVR